LNGLEASGICLADPAYFSEEHLAYKIDTKTTNLPSKKSKLKSI
jgi:hypothetical protein